MKKTITVAFPLVLLGSNIMADEVKQLDAIEVNANRLDSNLISPARQVTVLNRKQIEEEMTTGASLAEVLAKLVPGMGQPSQTYTNYAQNLRGREALVLVDGVPMNTNRDVSRVLFNTSSDSIEKIEIVRGGNAIYGSGATGGVIFITTREATADHRRETGVGFSSQTSFDSKDGLGYRAYQGLSGSFDSFDYAATLSYEHAGSRFDADGDRIAPEPSQGDMFDADMWEASAKLGWDLAFDQRLQMTLMHYQADQDTDYGSDATVTSAPLRSVKARAVDGLQLSDQNTTENDFISLDYFHDDILKSVMHVQGYYRTYMTRFYPFDARGNASNAHLSQTEMEATVFGGRLTMTTPFEFLTAQASEVVWGMDLQSDESSMPVNVYDGAAFDASNGLVFVPTGKKTYMPPITNESEAVFAQLRHRFNQQWSMDFGVRYEDVSTEFNDFVTLPQTLQPNPVVTQGGKVTYDTWLGNASVLFSPVQGQEFYLSFNQGFDLPDIGLQVRNAQPGFDLNSSDLQALETDTLELGWRGIWEQVSASFAIYQSTSDLGRVQTENYGLTLFRNKEEINGLEATIDATLDDDWRVGSTLTYIVGEETPDGGDTVDMNGFRIPPLKWTLSVEYQIAPNWSNRIDAMYSASEDYRIDGNESFGRREVDSYWALDWTSRWTFNSSHLDVGLENLLNEEYYPVYSQLLRSSTNTSHIPARGRTLRVSYVMDW